MMIFLDLIPHVRETNFSNDFKESDELNYTYKIKAKVSYTCILHHVTSIQPFNVIIPWNFI